MLYCCIFRLKISIITATAQVGQVELNRRVGLQWKRRAMHWLKTLKETIDKKKGQMLTIMAIPTGDDSVKSISLPLLWVHAGLIVFASIIVFLTASYLGMTATIVRTSHDRKAKELYIEQLSKDNAVLMNINRENEKRFNDLNEKLARLEGDLAYLDSLSGEITDIIKGKTSTSAGTSISSRGGYNRAIVSGPQAELPEMVSLTGTPNEALDLMEHANKYVQTIGDRLIRVQEHSNKVKVRLSSLKESAGSYRDRLNHTPHGMPTRGRLTSRFGSRRHPITGRIQTHGGIDLAAPTGTPIVATADGTVSFSGLRSGYGRAVIINHGYGFQTLYGHASRLVVSAGQKVKHGQVIAYVGSSGVSTGSHLHYEVHVSGKPVDPWPYVQLNYR
jgi:murein DD-endopeptidase MepM/ murein hydrolase activator NlpD